MLQARFFPFLISLLLSTPSLVQAQVLDLKLAQESLKEKDWKTHRGISLYVDYLVGDVQELMTLDEHDHILDLGAGEGIFSRQMAGKLQERDYPQFKERTEQQIPKLTLVTFEDHDLGTPTEKYNPLVGKLFEEIPKEDLLRLGKINRVYELWGVLAYTYHPILVLKKLYAIMEDKGIYIVKTGPRIFDHPQRSRMYASLVNNDSGQLSLVDWLKLHVKGFHVSLIHEGSYYEALKFVKDESIAFDAPDLIFQYHTKGCEPRPRIFKERKVMQSKY